MNSGKHHNIKIRGITNIYTVEPYFISFGQCDYKDATAHGFPVYFGLPFIFLTMSTDAVVNPEPQDLEST